MQATHTPSGDSHSISTCATPAPRPRGRPRVHANDSAKTAAYRARKRALAPPKSKHHRFCRGGNSCLCDLPMSKGAFLTGAPQGCGELISGGYDSEKAASICDLEQTKEIIGGKRVGPSGCDPDAEREWGDKETDSTFINKQEFPLEWKESEEQKALRSTATVVEKPTCCQCGGPASTVHPKDAKKKLSEARFLCGGDAKS